MIGPSGIYIDGLPRGDVFLWTPEERVRNLFVDQSIADRMLAGQHYHFGAGAREAFVQYIERRMQQPHFANARSVRNALDHARLRAASRLFGVRDRPLTESDLTTLAPEDILASRVFDVAA